MALTDSHLQFERIKHLESSGKTSIKFAADTGRIEDDVYTVKTDELPHPEFFEALARLKPHVQDVLQGKADYMEDVTILGVQIKRNDDPPKEIVVTGMKEVGTGLTFIFNTPAIPPGAGAEDALRDLFTATKRLLDGKRADPDLFDGEDDEKPSPAELAEKAAEFEN